MRKDIKYIVKKQEKGNASWDPSIVDATGLGEGKL